jgi:LacI family transcriptional regulator
MSEQNGSGPAKAPTLEDVARLAGVSRNTVSLAVRASPLVRPETRERVLRFVRQTGYRPNRAARSLARARAETIGLVQFGQSPPSVESWYGTMVTGVRRALEASGYDLLLFSGRRLGGARSLDEPVVSGRVDGLVVLGTATDRAAVAAAWRSGIRLVHVGRRDFGTDVPYVSSDDAGGMTEALGHLRRHGHTRIAFVGEDLRFEPTRDKLEAYRRFHAEHDGSPARELAVEARPHEAARVDAAARALLERGMTAGVVVRDLLALALVRAFRAAGVRVPEDFALIGYDNLEWAPLTEPPLTCIGPPRLEMGLRAGRAVVDLVEGRPVSSPVVLPTRMVARRSCGCAWDPTEERREAIVWPDR